MIKKGNHEFQLLKIFTLIALTALILMLMPLKFFYEYLKDSSLGDPRGILQRILVGSTIKDLYRKTPIQDYQGLTKKRL
jgi:hypothetical protein